MKIDPTDERFDVRSGEYPDDANIPFWVDACIRFQPPTRNGKPMTTAADKVHTVARFLAAERVLSNELDLQLIAMVAGYSRPDEVSWIIDYLCDISFLKVDIHGRDPKTGRNVRNTYDVFKRPPLHYVGPRTTGEIFEWLRDDVAAARAEHQASGKSGRLRAVAARPRTLFLETAGQPVPANPGTEDQPVPANADQQQETAGQPRTGKSRYGSEPRTGKSRYGDVYAGRPVPASDGPLIDREREEPLRGSSDRSKEAAPPVFAGPDAAAPDDGAVRQLVRRFPWKQRGVELSVPEADSVVAAIKAAMRDHGLTLEQAQAHGLAALGRATGGPRQRVVYVANAFSARHVRAAFLEPLAEDTLPLPDEAETPADRVEAQPQAAEAPDPHRPACDTCQAREGESNLYRTVIGEDDRLKPCPTCRSAETTPVTA